VSITGSGFDTTVLDTTLAVAAVVAAATAITGTNTDSSTVSGANVTLDVEVSSEPVAGAGAGAGASEGRTLCTAVLTLSGNGSLSTNCFGLVNVDRTDLSLPSGSSPIAAFMESGIGARFTILTKNVLIVLVGAFIKSIIPPKIPTIPTATPPRMVPVLLDAAAAASPAAVKLADVVGDDVVVGNGVNIKRGVEVTEKNVGLAEAEIENHDTDGVDVFVPVKLKAIVPDQEILVDSVALGDQDPVPVSVRVVVPVPVPVPVGKTEKLTL